MCALVSLSQVVGRGWHAYALLPLLAVGENRSAAILAAHSQNAVAAGLGRGEAAAALGAHARPHY